MDPIKRGSAHNDPSALSKEEVNARYEEAKAHYEKKEKPPQLTKAQQKAISSKLTTTNDFDLENVKPIKIKE